MKADLAVVGGGPRALQALVALERESGAPLTVDVYEPGELGAGAVWDPTQPPHLLLNVDASIVDLTGGPIGKSFREWAAQHLPAGLVDATYPPRRMVGAYLAWCGRRLLSDSNRLLVRHRRLRVLDVLAETPSTGWRLRGDGWEERADRVLLCTGHEDGGGIDHAALVDGTVPGTGPGEAVVIRGAALTAIDVVLDLTEGRGGRWSADDQHYVASGEEPSGIRLLSRSGELMIPKPVRPDPDLVASVAARTEQLSGRGDPDDRWWEIVQTAAQEVARERGVCLDPAAMSDVLEAGRPPGDPWRRLERDLARAEGRVDADPAWWWGRVWSAAYPAIVSSLERRPRSPSTWPRFLARAGRLEKWAFGPPPATARRLLALRRGGLLDLGADAAQQKVVLSAVTAPPGITGARGPWTGLRERGLVVVRPGERGALTTADAVCVDRGGHPVPGLFALGRPTEDPVIGHDTLSRSLHRDIAAWAASFDSRTRPRPDGSGVLLGGRS